MKKLSNQKLLPESKELTNTINYKDVAIPSIIIILIIALISGLVIILKPTNKLKRYLETFKYTCNNSICYKDIDNLNYSINYKQGKMTVSNTKYTITISNLYPVLELKDNTLTCYYRQDNYEPLTKIDKTFTDNHECQSYIEDVNNAITKFKELLNNANVSLDDFEDEDK